MAVMGIFAFWRSSSIPLRSAYLSRRFPKNLLDILSKDVGAGIIMVLLDFFGFFVSLPNPGVRAGTDFLPLIIVLHLST